MARAGHPPWDIVDLDGDLETAPAPLQNILFIGACAFALIAAIAALPERRDNTPPARSLAQPTTEAAVPTWTPNPHVDIGALTERTIALTAAVDTWAWQATSTRGGTLDAWSVHRWGDELFFWRRTEIGGRRSVTVSLDTRIPSAPCEIGTDATAAQLADWIAGRPGIVTTPRTAVTVAGLRGVTLDMTASSSDQVASGCPVFEGQLVIQVHQSRYGLGTRHPIGVKDNETARLYLFDLFEGTAAPRTLAVLILSEKDSFARLADEATPLLDSLLRTVAALN